MKQIIKINFCDFWSGFDVYNNYLYNLLNKFYDIEICDKPEYIIYSCYGNKHLKYKCFRIYYCGENLRINWNACDFALSSDYLQDERYYRLPHWVFYENPKELIKKEVNAEEIKKSKKGFCSFVVGNPNPKERIELFHKLSKYKKVDSGGIFLNNIEKIYSQENKMEFIKKYKFTIAFENSSYQGYTTEKIYQAMLANSIPIYWGDPMVFNDFNENSFINVMNYSNYDEVVEIIKKIDSDDKLYYNYLKQPWFVNNQVPSCVLEENVIKYFNKIFFLSNSKPVAQRLNKYYYKLQRGLQILDFEINKITHHKNNFR